MGKLRSGVSANEAQLRKLLTRKEPADSTETFGSGSYCLRSVGRQIGFLVNVKIACQLARATPPLAAWLRPPPSRQPATTPPATITANTTVNINIGATRDYKRGVDRTPLRRPITKQVTYPPTTARYLRHLRGFPAAVPSKKIPRGLPDAKGYLVSL